MRDHPFRFLGSSKHESTEEQDLIFNSPSTVLLILRFRDPLISGSGLTKEL